jgi:hypothetical protein
VNSTEHGEVNYTDGKVHCSTNLEFNDDEDNEIVDQNDGRCPNSIV